MTSVQLVLTGTAVATLFAGSASTAGEAKQTGVVIPTRDNPPGVPKLEQLPLRSSVSQYGITWTFREPVRAGQFFNGDWYIVGEAFVKGIDPPPRYGLEIAAEELDANEKAKLARGALKRDDAMRNGSMLNPPAKQLMAYDSGIRNWFRPEPAASQSRSPVVATPATLGARPPPARSWPERAESFG